MGHARPHFRIRHGLDLPLPGAPEQVIRGGPTVTRVALLTADHPELRARAQVDVGARVRLGQTLFVDRRRPSVRFASPASGVVREVRLGARRRLEAVVVECDGDDEEIHRSWPAGMLRDLSRDDVQENLLRSGLWTAFRARPFDGIPDPDTEPDAIFVTAIDTNPLAVDPAPVLAERAADFAHGLLVLPSLTRGSVHACAAKGVGLPALDHDRISCTQFEGPHPAGLPGTHVHLIDPVGPGRSVWHVGYQDVAAIGRLFTTGRLDPVRVVSIAGPMVREPQVVRTRLGAAVDDLVRGRLGPSEGVRVISGSVLAGRAVTDTWAALGRYHLQVSVLSEAGATGRRGRPFTTARWPLRRGGGRSWTTARHGRVTGLVPTEVYDDVFPFDIPAVPLLRALETGNVDTCLDLGCLELAEEDLALLTYVSRSKLDHGVRLREVLAEIRKRATDAR